MAMGSVRLATNVARTTREGASVNHGGRGPTRPISYYPDLETPFRHANEAMVKAGHDWYRSVMTVGDAIRGYGKAKDANVATAAAENRINASGGFADGGEALARGTDFWSNVLTWWK